MFEKVQALIAEIRNLPLEKITMESRLVEDLQADSLDLYDLLSRLEEEYEITVDTDEVESIVTVADIVEAIEKLVK